MVLTEEQIALLMKVVEATSDDQLDCDGCFEHLSEFAENELEGRSIPEALKVVETHLKNCPCCQHE